MGINQNHKSKSKARVDAKMTITAEMLPKGYTYEEIASEVSKRLGVSCSKSRVGDYVKKLLKEWQQERIENTDELVTAELQRINMVIREAWQMWEKSKGDYHKKGSRQIGLPADDGKAIQTVKAIMNDDEERGKGDPRYLDIILKALEQRRRLLGLDKINVDVNAALQGAMEIRLVRSEHPVATSEDEVRRREYGGMG